MLLRGVHHVSLDGVDVEEAAEFYAKRLGMAPIERLDLGFRGAWLSCGAGHLHRVGVETHRAREGQHLAVRVDAFPVDGLDAALEELQKAGVRTSRARAVAGGGRHAFLRDPAGNLLELQESRA